MYMYNTRVCACTMYLYTCVYTIITIRLCDSLRAKYSTIPSSRHVCAHVYLSPSIRCWTPTTDM